MITKEKLKSIMELKTNKEAAICLNVSERTIARWIKFYNLTYEELKYSTYPKIFFKCQSDFIHGSLLGDGHIDSYGRFKFKMKQSSEEYVNWSMLLLKPMSRDLKYEENLRRGKICKAVSYCTINYSLFKSLRNLWYSEGIKFIPNNFELNDEILFHWYLQDGCNLWQKKSIQFATHSFTLNDVEFLSYLLEKFNIKTTIQKNRKNQFTINIGARFYFDFLELLKEKSKFNCFSYKFDVSKCKKTMPNFGARKLNLKKAREIRHIFQNTNCTQKYLAKKFDVTQTAIGRILNNIVYKEN
jgi:hypothetical protein